MISERTEFQTCHGTSIIMMIITILTIVSHSLCLLFEFSLLLPSQHQISILTACFAPSPGLRLPIFHGAGAITRPV